MTENKEDQVKKVKVRWIDGFEKYYICSEIQFGKDNYCLTLKDGKEKWIPRENVRHVTTADIPAEELPAEELRFIFTPAQTITIPSLKKGKRRKK